MKTYTFRKAAMYQLTRDFYSDYLRIFSTPDDTVHLIAIATPMSDRAVLNIGKDYFAVYSDDGALFKIDIEETLNRNKYKGNDEPGINLEGRRRSYAINKTNKTDSFGGKRYPIYQAISKENASDTTEICIDTSSNMNTVPFLFPALEMKGLIYRIGNKTVLKEQGTIEDVPEQEDAKEGKESEEENSSKAASKPHDFIIRFDRVSAVREYKKAYHEKNKSFRP
ncbi:hypothetical protein [Niabella ginsenosidivorans]|nr:hypothetical protein [Niabella ginsenosidivorans]